MHPFYGPNSEFLAQGAYWWIGLLSMALYLIFWAVVIIIAVRMAKKYFMNSGAFKIKEDSAMNILRERYARGEINAEEIKKVKSDLEQQD